MEMLQSVKVQRLQTGFVDTNSLGYPSSAQSQSAPVVDPVQPSDQIDLNNQDQLKRQNQNQQSAKSDSALTSALKNFQDKINQMQYVNLEFSRDKDTDVVVVKVVDRETGKVIREIPDKEFLDLVTRMDKMVGILFDKKV